jgi:hypothetical protein
VDIEAEAEYGSERGMASHLEVQNIGDDISRGQTSKEKGETCEPSMEILIGTRVDVIKDICDFCERSDRDTIDSKKEGTSQILVAEMLKGIGARDETDDTKATKAWMGMKHESKRLARRGVRHMVIHKRVSEPRRDVGFQL